MNRLKRDYCSKNRHPRWRAWVAKYDMSVPAWTWLGNYCTECGARLDGVVGSGPTKPTPENVRRLSDRVFALRLKRWVRSITTGRGS